MYLTSKQQRIHSEAVRLTKIFKEAERDLVEVFIEAEETKLYVAFEKPSVYLYGVDVLGLSEGVSYNLMTVAKTSMRVPKLRAAIAEGKITATVAGRITAHVEEHPELIEFAATHSKRETEREVARLSPEVTPKDKVKHLSANQVQITVTLTREAYDALERTQSLLAQRDLPSTLSNAVNVSALQYVDRKDPVKKAERTASEFCPGRTGDMNAAETHAVNLRDQGRCNHRDQNGKRCNSDRWVEIHHIIPREHGGTNDLENLTTLCGFHHRQHHRNSA